VSRGACPGDMSRGKCPDPLLLPWTAFTITGRTGLIMFLDLFLVRFFFNSSVCPVWWTKLAIHVSFLLHVKYTLSYSIVSILRVVHGPCES